MFAVGDNVEIIDGPFYDFDATVKEVRPSEEKARVTISIYGRAETIELNFSQMRPAGYLN
ncbi:MAG: KOW motif-containing protein [Candidatus Binataceae bacterium]